jgi:uncharacterized protein (DUF1697 family)
MWSYVALLRGVNVLGAAPLPMRDLVRLCEEAGHTNVRTFIASGNAVFRSSAKKADVQAGLESRLAALTGKPIRVHVRRADEMAAVLRDNPWPHAPGNQAMAIFLDDRPTPSMLAAVKNQAPNEMLALGRREIYVWYGSGQGQSRLRIPAAQSGTARNMNTIAKLVALSAIRA